MIAPDSAIVFLPSVMTGDFPSGWTAFSSGGASGRPFDFGQAERSR